MLACVINRLGQYREFDICTIYYREYGHFPVKITLHCTHMVLANPSDFQADWPRNDCICHSQLPIEDYLKTTVLDEAVTHTNTCTQVADPVATPPVLEVKQDPTGRGRFAFIELRTAALALAALTLDKVSSFDVANLCV